MRISGSTQLLGIIGHPIEHTLSPRMHNAVFESSGLNYVFVAMDVEPRSVRDAVKGAAALGFRGLCVTMPHKGAVLPLLDEVDEVVRLSGSVNTIVMDGSELRGYNTDGDGFVDACREAGIELGGSRVLLIGAGRVAAAIAVSLRGEGVNELRIVDREEDHAAELMGRLRGMKGFVRVRTYLLDELDEVATGANVIINATPLGMRDADPLPIPVEYLDEGKGVCDVVYRTSEETELVRQARERGARVASGRRLLLYQGVRQQRLWTGREPDVRVMDDAIS